MPALQISKITYSEYLQGVTAAVPAPPAKTLALTPTPLPKARKNAPNVTRNVSQQTSSSYYSENSSPDSLPSSAHTRTTRGSHDSSTESDSGIIRHSNTHGLDVIPEKYTINRYSTNVVAPRPKKAFSQENIVSKLQENRSNTNSSGMLRQSSKKTQLGNASESTITIPTAKNLTIIFEDFNIEPPATAVVHNRSSGSQPGSVPSSATNNTKFAKPFQTRQNPTSQGNMNINSVRTNNSLNQFNHINPKGSNPLAQENTIASTDSNFNAAAFNYINHNFPNNSAQDFYSSTHRSSSYKSSCKSSYKSSLRRSRASNRKRNWRKHILSFGDKLKLKFRNWRSVARRVARRKSRTIVTNKYHKHTPTTSTSNARSKYAEMVTNSPELLSDKNFLKKYAEKKKLKNQKRKQQLHRRKTVSLKKSLSLIKNKKQFNDGLSLIPPIASVVNNKDSGNSGQREFSQLTMQNIEKFTNLPNYEPLNVKGEFIDKYVSEVSKEIQDNKEKYLISKTSASSLDKEDAAHGDAKLPSGAHELSKAIVTTISSPIDVRKESTEVQPISATLTKRDDSVYNSLAGSSDEMSTANPASISSYSHYNDALTDQSLAKEPVKNKSLPSFKTTINDQSSADTSQKVVTESEDEQIIDPKDEAFLNEWESYLKNSVAQRASIIRKDFSYDQSLGNYTTDATTIGDKSMPSNVSSPLRNCTRMNILGEILPATQEEQVKVGNSNALYDDNATITEYSDEDFYNGDEDDNDAVSTKYGNDSNAGSFTPFPTSDKSSRSANSSRHSVAKTKAEFKPAVSVHSLHSENDNVSLSTVESGASVKTSEFSETNFYSIADTGSNKAAIETKLANLNLNSVADYEEADQDGPQIIHDLDLVRSNTVLIKKEYNDEKSYATQKFMGNTKSILDILSVPESSISGIDEMDLIDSDPDFSLSRQNYHNKSNLNYKNSISTGRKSSIAFSAKTISNSNKSLSDMSRGSSIKITPLNLRSKKSNSMNDMHNLKLENKLRSISNPYFDIKKASPETRRNSNFINQRLEPSAENRKAINAAIVRSLIENRQRFSGPINGAVQQKV